MYIAFDIGNVLIDISKTYDFFHKISQYSSVNLDSWQLEEEILRLLDLGANIHTAIRKATHLNKFDAYKFVSIWENNTLTEIKPINELLSTLIKRGHNIALLSNIGIDHADIIRKNFIYNKCVQHFSYEVGAIKPSKLFYQSFLISNPEFKHCLYIDDKIDNVVSAKREGFKAVHFALDQYDNHDIAAKELTKILESNLFLADG